MDFATANTASSAGGLDAGSGVWSAEAAAELLANHQYQLVVDAVDRALDDPAHRLPTVVGWCLEWGFRQGHVPPLYKLVRNFLHFGVGMVPTTDMTAFGIKCALLLLLRAAQDAAVCVLDLARPEARVAFDAVAAKTRGWALPWFRKEGCAPTVEDAAAALQPWAGAGAPCPLPAWPTCFETGYLLSSRFGWGTPRQPDLAALTRNRAGHAATRAAVGARFLVLLGRHAGVAGFVEGVGPAMFTDLLEAARAA